MARERLSKLQKWILCKCYKELELSRRTVREFFGKKFPPSKRNKELTWIDKERVDEELFDEKQKELREYDFNLRRFTNETYTSKYYVAKERYVSTRSEEATISRALKNLTSKGLLKKLGKWDGYQLTEQGFLVVNNSASGSRIVNVNGFPAGGRFVSFKQYQEAIEKQSADLKREGEERTRRILALMTGQASHIENFALEKILDLCCEECRDKILEFQKNSGTGEKDPLESELEDMANVNKSVSR